MKKDNENIISDSNMMICNTKLGEVVPNIAQMLRRNADKFGNKIVFREKRDEKYIELNWNQLYTDICNIASNLKKFGFNKGDKMVIFSRNRFEMLELELALMAADGVAVPIFFNYSSETAEQLIQHSDAKFLTVGNTEQLDKIIRELPLKHIFIFNELSSAELTSRRLKHKNLHPFSELLNENKNSASSLNFNTHPDDICLNMYTSGTMGNEKCVQLSHKNILSQQAAIQVTLNLDANDRFLSYLRWHHSFGGIFEIFGALYNGASMTLESSLGTDPAEILKNWKEIKPTVFFSVPLIYQAIIDLIGGDKKAEEEFFHPGLKFVFTAAAPLPKRISDEFEMRKIPVVEGYGLTETSPCCTLTDPEIKREPGVVGFPIPGVTIKLAEDGEILVKGPNIMKCYYKNDLANKDIFTDDGWFCTGDIGEITDSGLRLITRKDRIFKLLNAEKVIPTRIESSILKKCPYISYALVEGKGRNYPVALLFPNHRLLDKTNNVNGDFPECNCPEGISELSGCLSHCLKELNYNMNQKFSWIKAAMLVDDELSIENKTLTPSLKLAPNNVKEFYKSHIEKLYGEDVKVVGNVYILPLDE